MYSEQCTLAINATSHLESRACDLSEKNTDGNQMDKLIDLLGELANSLFGLTVWCIETIINNNGLKFYL